MSNTATPITPNTLADDQALNKIKAAVASWRGVASSRVPNEIVIFDFMLKKIDGLQHVVSSLELDIQGFQVFTNNIREQLALPFWMMLDGKKFELRTTDMLKRFTPLQSLELDRRQHQSDLNRTNRELERISPEHYQKTDPRRSA